MSVSIWIYVVFIFALGCCIGSFLNVVIYRLPRERSLVNPPSFCPVCGVHIRFYDNIPLISYLLLWGRCRYCRTPISPRYFLIELLTGATFTGLFLLYFVAGIRHFEIGSGWGIGAFLKGGWFIYLLHIILAACLIAASAIDLELWIIPISICWFVTAIGFFASTIGRFVIKPIEITGYFLLPAASPLTGALAIGAAIGTGLSLLLLACGVLKQSYQIPDEKEIQLQNYFQPIQSDGFVEYDKMFNHRFEMFKELIFLLPIVVFSLLGFLLVTRIPILNKWWVNFSQSPYICGFLGSLWGYFVGCAVVWVTRIVGTLIFGREAMGLGDVHLMGAAGAILGPVFVVIAFFVAPFFGLTWAIIQMVFEKNHKIPYGPFLSMGILSVMILHDWFIKNLAFVFYG